MSLVIKSLFLNFIKPDCIILSGSLALHVTPLLGIIRLEDILVFSLGSPIYNPQGIIECNKRTGTGVSSKGKQGDATGKITQTSNGKYTQTTTGYPRNVLDISSEGKTIHPTQKPVALFEYLIKTYTNEEDLVLDNCMGSGTTAIAAINTGRHFIGIEKDPRYIELSERRIAAKKKELEVLECAN